MKGIDSTGASLVHVPGWVDGSKSRFKDCLQLSKMTKSQIFICLKSVVG
jgi:hypothetical protein